MDGGLTVDHVQGWAEGLAGLHARFVSRFARSEPRARALEYMAGLMAPPERTNGWTPAGHGCPDGIQRPLNAADWDADGVRDFAVETIGDPLAVLIGDDTGFVTKGRKSAGAARQYTGTAGKKENRQIGTFLAHASTVGRSLIDRELYLPASWTAARDRCRAAGIPDEVGFATKIEQMPAMPTRALAAGVPFAWFTAEEAYGQVKSFRVWLEHQAVAHVVATRCNDTVATRTWGEARVDALIADLPRQARRRSAGGRAARLGLGSGGDPPALGGRLGPLGAGEALDHGSE